MAGKLFVYEREAIPNSKEKLERVDGLLEQARAVLSTIDMPKPEKSSADYFVGTLAANINNADLSDAEFRQFVRNSLPTLNA